jgi:hypothetical protein
MKVSLHESPARPTNTSFFPVNPDVCQTRLAKRALNIRDVMFKQIRILHKAYEKQLLN